MPRNGTPRRPKPIYCPSCERTVIPSPDVGCVACAARAATPGGLRLRPDAEPAYELSADEDERRREVRAADLEKRKATNGYYYSVAPLFLKAIRRDRRRRIYPKH